MAVKLLVLQHTPWEGPGVFLLDAAQKLNVKLIVVKVWKENIPDFERYDGLLVLGGTPNVGQEKQYPFLIAEKQLVRRAIAADKPYLGFCLGHQLLAEALGAKVGPNFCASIGYVEGHLTHDGREHPVFENFPKRIPLFKWHSQAALTPLPKHLSVLVTSAECQIEALSVAERPHILGVQYDNHAASPADVARWLEKDQSWLESFPDREIDSLRIIKESERHAAIIGENFTRFFANYISLLR